MLETSEWLDDAIITAAQYSLKSQHPAIGGLQPPVLATKLAMEPQTGEFVQILNIQRNHWMLVSTVGCQMGHVNVYDSLHLHLSSKTKTVVADLLRHEGSTITLHYCGVQWQSGCDDCGLFAIAFATALCHGHEPAMKVYDQAKMRKHLRNCLINGKVIPFPERARAHKRVVEDPMKEEFAVYCICRLPDNGSVMVQCERCQQWYHTTCVRVPKRFLKKVQRTLLL